MVLKALFAVLQCSSGLLSAAARGLSQNWMTESESDKMQADGRSAKAFCAAPSLQSLQCGFASESENSATTKRQCHGCGSWFRPLARQSELPKELEGHSSYPQYAYGLVSLACKGPVVVRSVFKMLKDVQPTRQQARNYGLDGTDCSSVRLESGDGSRSESPSVRCEVEVPSTGSSEEAVIAKEGKCWTCRSCRDGKGGCPSVVGKWYSDSYTSVATGCDFDAQKGYSFHRAGMSVGAGVKILLAKVEVCNSPGCVDAAYEQQKQQAAKPCVKGKCA